MNLTVVGMATKKTEQKRRNGSDRPRTNAAPAREREQGVRCYFMRDGHIAAVEILNNRTDDKAAIAEAQALFAASNDKFTGFEVWDRARFLYRHPASPDG